MCPQRSILRGSLGPGEADRPDVCGEVHPQEGPEGEGEQHRERDRRAEEVSAVRQNTQTQSLLKALVVGATVQPLSPLRASLPLRLRVTIRSPSTAHVHTTAEAPVCRSTKWSHHVEQRNLSAVFGVSISVEEMHHDQKHLASQTTTHIKRGYI